MIKEKYSTNYSYDLKKKNEEIFKLEKKKLNSSASRKLKVSFSIFHEFYVKKNSHFIFIFYLLF